MASSDPTAGEKRGDSALAFSIMFFGGALLGLADGVRHDTRLLGIPETDSWLVASTVLCVIGGIFLTGSGCTMVGRHQDANPDVLTLGAKVA